MLFSLTSVVTITGSWGSSLAYDEIETCEKMERENATRKRAVIIGFFINPPKIITLHNLLSVHTEL